MPNRKNKARRFWIPVAVIVIILLGLIFSPHFFSWVSDTFLSINGGTQVHVDWQNQAELVSSLPNFQFQVSRAGDAQILEGSFFIEPQISGTWSWLDNYNAIWQADQALPIGEKIRFGFTYIDEPSQSNIKIQPVDWQVYVRETEIAVLKQVSEGKEIFVISQHTPPVEKQLTFTSGQVIDFAVSTSGDRIVFSQQNEDFGADLWMVGRDGGNLQLVLDCGKSRCTSLDWHPNRDEILYVMEEVSSPGNNLNPAKPMILNLNTGISTPVFQDPEQIGYDPLWSSRGQWITVWNGIESGISVVHADSREPGFSDLQSDDTGCWSPDDRTLYYSKVREEGLPIVSNIYQVDIVSGLRSLYTTSDLFELGYNFYYPACNPNGDGLMVAVQIDPKVPQRELWWIFPDGHYKVIYDDLSQLVTQYSWNPNGSKVLFLSDTLTGLSDGSQVGVWDSQSETISQNLSDDVFKALWLP